LGVVEHGMWENQLSLGSLVAAASAFACLAAAQPCDSAGGTKEGHDKPCRSCDIQPTSNGQHKLPGVIVLIKRERWCDNSYVVKAAHVQCVKQESVPGLPV